MGQHWEAVYDHKIGTDAGRGHVELGTGEKQAVNSYRSELLYRGVEEEVRFLVSCSRDYTSDGSIYEVLDCFFRNDHLQAELPNAVLIRMRLDQCAGSENGH